MAYYANTTLLDALTKLQEAANKDLRAPAYGVTRAFNDRKRNVILNYDQFAMQNSDVDLQGQKVDYLRRRSATAGTSRSASLTGAYGTSTRDTLTWATYTDEFTLSDDNMRDNTMGPQMLANEIRNARLNIGSAIETAGVTKLEAFRNQVDVSSPHSTWDGTNYINKVANANEDRFFNIMETEMRMRDYNGPLQIINYGSMNEVMNWQGAQGVGNSSNLQFQYGDKMFYTSNTITNGSDYVGTSYVCEEDSLALVDWIPAKNREGLVNHNDFTFTSMPDPFGIFDNMALAVQKSVADTSATGTTKGGNTQDAVWKYEVSVDIAFFIPTITTQKLVNKYGLLTT
ncbi:MAG: hypothetical protein ACXABN_19220 [Candidatus Thorarchaeota archaeon]|jgi:hypothetical protein